MKRAVSISIGSSKRNKAVEVQLLGETVSIERIGTDGDMEAAALKYKELDGKVDAFGVGGADLGTYIEGNFYPYHSVQKLTRYIEKTPVVDGGGLKNTLENKAPSFLEKTIGGYINSCGRKVMLPMGLDRWGLSKNFVEAGYETTFCDWMFALGVLVVFAFFGFNAYLRRTIRLTDSPPPAAPIGIGSPAPDPNPALPPDLPQESLTADSPSAPPAGEELPQNKPESPQLDSGDKSQTKSEFYP